MPFDFTNLKPYVIDYDLLFDSLEKLPLLDDQKLQQEYLLNWKNNLQRFDKVIVEQLNTPQKIANYQSAINKEEEFEIFQQEYTFFPSQVKIFFHYRVSVIFKSLEHFNQMNNSQKINLIDFTNKESKIKWTNRQINLLKKYNNTPIFLIPFFDKQYNYLVIDGNHRISHAVALNKKNINGFSFSEKSVIDNQWFCSGFDKILYIFYNEMNHFANNKKYNNTPDYELLMKSYLSNKGFQFDQD
ncbi:hypothetical protein JZO82_04105 [Vagococcus fluvialis]|uniref:hypothetical protein n=1 Tax=Vagococcus fluvialis TaxID=2738 RepID=UPI001A8ECC78|nr:hypothetical protein [Vagococcus fluvialis]MBO0428339.1 hypothetical protein [Vagococcus fluvialis]